LSLAETKAISEMADLLYDFLPGKAHPYADPSISFAGIANEMGLGRHWRGGSKRPAIAALLEGVLAWERGQFCPLMVEIVRRAIQYRATRANPITQKDIRNLNALLARVEFKIPELTDRAFVAALAGDDEDRESSAEGAVPEQESLAALRDALLGLGKLDRQRQGYEFERIVGGMFEAFSLSPRKPFRVTGEQIDGSFELDHDTYLVEARWRAEPAAASDLYVLREKVAGKAAWSRGIFISNAGFSSEGMEAFGR